MIKQHMIAIHANEDSIPNKLYMFERLLLGCSLLDTSSDIVAIIMLLLCRFISLLLPDILPDDTLFCIIYGLLMLYLFVLQDNTAANLLLLLLCTSYTLCFDLLIANASILIDISSSTIMKHRHGCHHRFIAIENVAIALSALMQKLEVCT